MPSLSSGIQLALQAVLTHSQAIEIIEHNVANANTPGYRRQAAMLTAGHAIPGYGLGMDFSPGTGQRGAGVLIERIQRFNLDIVDSRFRSATAESGAWGARQELSVRLESMLAETSDGGLIPAMDEFWSSWQNLASDPTNLSLRTVLIDNARTLASSIQSRAQELSSFRADQNNTLVDRTSQINSAASQVAELNSQISRVLAAGDQPNDLMDKRDLLLDQLSNLTGAVANPQADGQVIVNIGGHVLVGGTKAHQLTAAIDPTDPDGAVKISWADGQTLAVPSGEIKGILDVRDNLVKSQLTGLNQLAGALIAQVNLVHNAGFGLDNTTNLDFFSGTDAFTIQVDGAIDETTLAAAGAIDQPGDNSVAMLMSGLKFSKVVNGNTQTLNEFYNGQVTSMGVDTERAISNSSHHKVLLKALGDQRESFSGVSLDEEAADMAKYQRAYQAAARIMNVYDEMLDKVINGMGLVGR
jgi:flagellar hook-associated protein 1 FlgK